MGTGVIITMAGITIASAVSQSLLSSMGKQAEAQYMDLATKSGLIALAISGVLKAIAAVKSLGG